MQAFDPLPGNVVPIGSSSSATSNSTLACSLVAAKLKVDLGCRIAHVEAGLRSRDWSMPEEVNRVLTDRLSDLLLTTSAGGCPEPHRRGNRRRSYRARGQHHDRYPDPRHFPRARRCGRSSGQIGPRRTPGGTWSSRSTDPPTWTSRSGCDAFLEGLGRITAKEIKVAFPVHPRTRQRVEAFGLGSLLDWLFLVTEPLGYHEMLGLMDAFGRRDHGLRWRAGGDHRSGCPVPHAPRDHGATRSRWIRAPTG